ncbi:MAG: GAF domain-containing protein [Longimicrobiales bacterium]|nr:GAF domain-containing protein [Longimicrobiales bacterium]
MIPPSEAPDRTDPTRSDRPEVVADEIRDAAASASTPVEVYRTALARVTPRVGATFASVFLRDEDAPDLLRLACAQNWPQASARFLGDLRIREGRGPTGQAVAQGRPVEVVDVFDDQELEEWWEPARELGFVAMTAHPLVVDGRAIGAISFYFSDPQRLDDEVRSLLGVVAREMATVAGRVRQG